MTHFDNSEKIIKLFSKCLVLWLVDNLNAPVPLRDIEVDFRLPDQVLDEAESVSAHRTRSSTHKASLFYPWACHSHLDPRKLPFYIHRCCCQVQNCYLTTEIDVSEKCSRWRNLCFDSIISVILLSNTFSGSLETLLTKMRMDFI